MFIVKIQRPLYVTPGTPSMALIYDESREHFENRHMTRELTEAWFPDEEMKVYRYATLKADGKFDILGPAPLQSW